MKRAEARVAGGWLVFSPGYLRRVARKGLSIYVARHRQTPRDLLVVSDECIRLRVPALKGANRE